MDRTAGEVAMLGPKTIGDALKFVSWFRRMVIEGQITIGDYATQCKVCSDYLLQEDLDALKKHIEGRTVSIEDQTGKCS